VIASSTLGIYKRKPMESISALKRQRKDDLIQQLLATTKDAEEKGEKTAAAGVIGGIAGFLLGIAMATM
jgi:hypothetical protein